MNIKKMRSNVHKIVRQKYLYFMAMPGILWCIIFSYAPMAGLYIAFVDFKPSLGGFWRNLFESRYVGGMWFEYIFAGYGFINVLRNTLASSVLTLIFGFICPIIIALSLNEVRWIWFKRIVQTSSYLPYFISWVIASNIVVTILSSEGIVNAVLMLLGITKASVLFLQNGSMFWYIIASANTWKEMGYNSIIYLAAIASINPELFDVAQIDGAGRVRQLRYIMIPLLMPTIMVILILSIGNLLNTGFDQYFLLGNSLNREYSDVIDTYAFRYGIQNGMFSYAAAVSLFKSVFAFGLVISANKLSKAVGSGHLF